MISRIAFYLFVTTFLFQHVACFQILNTNEASSSTSTLQMATSTSLNYATDVQSLETTDSFRNSILNTYQPDEPQISIAQLLTEQVAREFTTGRRYLLAASAVKQLSDNFYDVEEQQRVRAIELLEYARTHDIEILDYASQVDKRPIDKAMETTELLQELLVQEQRDMKLLDQVMAQVGSKNAKLFAFLEIIRADQMDRQDQITQTLSGALPSLQHAVVDTAASVATPHVSTADIPALMTKLESKIKSAEQLPFSLSRQLQVMGQHIHDLVSKSSHFTISGATAATVAAVDSVDPESLPTTEDILQAVDSLPTTDDFLQAMDTATTLFEEPSQLVDAIQQSVMDTEALNQIVDIVSGLY